ncbi:hypothetical protein Z045_05675 [Rhodococcus pyridinivorans KG-16]|uniref:Phage tail tape measure protein domain-containing protein n=1 Tax=Rhodococcus pyridinivorans KG-16 TaxID=1441730 RepID=A0A0V9UNT3_9NOCA|nr:hypothetical protein Z045_05675 [Rhodococcus pyridinivorans KG-16]
MAGLGVAIKSAGDYESSLSQLRQASGATNHEMAGMARLARELGQSNDLAGVSAADAARTMVELSKAGLSVKDTMNSSKAVMALAKAGNIDFAEAAVIAASSLNAFGLEGKQAIQVADTLAAGANASQAELADLALGLQQSATVAKQFKLSLNENVTALALFANNGIKGSDAGTSLKTMLIALAKPSAASAKLMRQIGFEAYNASGEFVGLEEMSKRLKKATADMTEEQKQNALATIFGTDAFRAAAVLADNAGDSYAKMSEAVGKSGAAQEAAAAQMGPYQKAVEGLRNAMSELGLAVGTKLLPYATAAAHGLADMVDGATRHLPSATKVFDRLVDGVADTAEQVGRYLIPSFRDLLSSVRSNVLPTLDKLLSEVVLPMARIVGGALVLAIREAARAMTFLANSAQPLVAVLLGVGATMATLRVASMVTAFIGLAGGINASAIAVGLFSRALLLLNMNPVVLGVSLLVGGFTALISLQSIFSSSTDRAKAAIDAHKVAQDALAQANRDAKLAQDALNGAVLSAEGAALAVERAQRTYNDTVAQYGPNSLEAREAAHRLREAEERLAQANLDVKNKTQEKQAAESEAAKKRDELTKAEAVKQAALNQTRDAANNAAGGFRNIGLSIDELNRKEVKPKGFDANSSPLTMGKVLGKNASGTAYWQGGATLVGENGPEIVRLPQGAQVTPAYRTRNELNQGGGGVTVNITGPVTFADRTDIDYFAERLNRAQRLALKGA